MSLSHVESIVTLLRTIGRRDCLSHAETLERATSFPARLHLRDLNLQPEELKPFAQVLAELAQEKAASLRSLSFSYNPIGDEGAIALSESLPSSLHEIGMVGCGIGEAGGRAILNRLRSLPQLTMACLEHNQFSAGLKDEFKRLSQTLPSLLVIV